MSIDTHSHTTRTRTTRGASMGATYGVGDGTFLLEL